MVVDSWYLDPDIGGGSDAESGGCDVGACGMFWRSACSSGRVPLHIVCGEKG